jgi:Kdo2-lipid IVA lauroyltransferase/acyltransferase
MANIKYFIQYIIILVLFIIYKLLGLKYSRIISAQIFRIFGPFFRSNKISNDNLKRAFDNLDKNKRKKILKKMWSNYGKIFAEYMFIKSFRNNQKIFNNIVVENKNILHKIKKNSKPVIFISGHFNNFELMAMTIEKSGIDLAAIYRPLNNKYLNPIMENIRKKYICKKQIKKGISGTRSLLKHFKNGSSIALMVDQRVSEGIRCNFFNEKASTTTIPAQFVKKFNSEIVPVYIERSNNDNFKIKFFNSLKFKKNDNIEAITLKINKILEDLIIKNPDQWIWTHNRWK